MERISLLVVAEEEDEEGEEKKKGRLVITVPLMVLLWRAFVELFVAARGGLFE